jgi:hypothetical protein
MADTDLGVTGKDAQITLSRNGVVAAIADAVVSRSAEPVLTEITQKHLGTSDVDVDVEHEGWKGEIEVTDKTSEIDEILDAVISDSRLRIPGILNYVETTHYRDGSSKTYVYPDIKIVSASKSAKRGEATTHRLSWRTGKNRIAA